jgi:hypothetical protein
MVVSINSERRGRGNDMSKELLDIVTWTTPSRELYHRRVEHLGRTASQLSAALRDLGGRFSRRGRVAAAIEAFEALAEAPLLRILGAPECCWQIHRYLEEPSPRLLDELEGWLAVEGALGGGELPERGGWSALGDESFADPFAPAEPDRWGLPVGPDARYTAPTHAGVVLDFVSPGARRPPRSHEQRAVRIEAPVPMTISERQVTLGRISAALDALAASPAAHDFVTALTGTIVPRRDGLQAGFYTSASARNAIGRTVLTNPFGPRVTQAMLISSLVHEAIHTYLYIDEQRRPLVTDWHRAYDTVVTSPWTGGALTVPTYLHGCYVWHGLANLWCLPEMIRAVGEGPAQEQRLRAVAGFASGAISPLTEVRALVSPVVWNVLERMHDETLQHAA